ncbi:MAG: hypothetical protein WCK33_08510 [Phycisphaerae bacterium]
MNRTALTTWHVRLSRAAMSRLASFEWPPRDANMFRSSFRDDAGHRRPVDGAFLAHLTGKPPLASVGTSPECVLWTQVATAPQGRDGASIDALIGADPRALAMSLREAGIEIWTETELACLHALTWLGPRWASRAALAARFLIEELQPDNGTNHPWAIHWFAWLETMHGDTDAGMYAQSLLHNAMTAGGGMPDLFSALILHDAATWLDARLTSGDA